MSNFRYIASVILVAVFSCQFAYGEAMQGNVRTYVDLPSQDNYDANLIETSNVGLGKRYIKPETNKIGAPVFQAWLRKTHGDFCLKASQFAPNSVIEIKGEWDDASRTLNKFGINHQSLKRSKLKDINLAGTRVLVINCAGNVPRESLQKIRDFVAGGGYLLTTDWALDGCIERVFPGYIQWNKAKSNSEIVDAYVIDKTSPYFKNTVDVAGWKLDDAAHTIRVLKPNSVRVLAVSKELAKEDPDGKGILAVVFSFGRGKVLHMIGHFDNNAFFAFTDSLPDPAPNIGISLRQALATNFVVEGLSR